MSLSPLTFGEAIHVKHGYAFEGEYFSSEGQYIVLTPGNFYERGGFRARPGKDRYYTGDIPEAYLLKDGDLIVAMTEQGPGLLGSSARIPEADRYLHNQRLGLVDQIDARKLHKGYLYHLFNTAIVRGQINGSATGTKVRHTAPERIYRVRVEVPTVDVQEKIADTLDQYELLISNNKQRIELLEQSARLLFKEWFVHLRYPGHEHDKVVDGMPEGWALRKFSELVDFKEGPGLRNYQYRDEGIPFLNIRTFGDDEIDLTKTQYLDENEVESRYRHFLLKEDDHVVSSSGTLGRVVTIRSCHLPLMLNTSVIRMRPTAPMKKWFLKAYLKHGAYLQAVTAMATGAAQLNYGPLQLKLLEVVIPPAMLLDEYEEFAKPIYEQVKLLLDSTMQLRRARDLLLPRLMDGRISV